MMVTELRSFGAWLQSLCTMGGWLYSYENIT